MPSVGQKIPEPGIRPHCRISKIQKTINCPSTISMAFPKTAMTSNTVTDIKLNTNTTMQRNKPNLNIGLTLNM